MQVQGWLSIFICGCLGGALMELLRWWKIREAQAFPHYARKPGYWLITILMIIAGGGGGCHLWCRAG